MNTMVIRRHARELVSVLALCAIALPWVIVCGARYPSEKITLAGALFLVVLLAFYVGYQQLRAARVRELPFLLCLGGLGLVYLVAFTPGTVPDEPNHFWSAYGLANLIMGQPIDAAAHTLAARAGDATIKLEEVLQLTLDAYAWVGNHFSLVDPGGEAVTVTVPALALDFSSNVIWFKLPSALGIVVARVLGLGVYPLFYLGRVCNLVVFVALAYLAVRITPVAKLGFRAVALLPMTLHVAASYSYDAEVIGMALVVSALVIRLVYTPDRCGARELVALPVCLALLAPCKLVYSVLAFAVVFVPAQIFPSRRAAWAYRIGVLAVTACSVLALRATALLTLAQTGSPTTMDVRGSETGEFYALSDFITNPGGMALLIFNTLVTQADFYLTSMVGGALAWFQQNIMAPWWLVVALVGLLVLAWVPCRAPQGERRGSHLAVRAGGASDADRAELASLRPSSTHRVVFVVIVLLGCGAVLLSMCVGWTFTTEQVIQGVQGRYFIPFLPLALWAVVYGSSLEVTRSPERLVMTGFLLLNGMNVINIVTIALSTWQ